jgi:pimeloyl-ACP methyl ester carboxylesterase
MAIRVQARRKSGRNVVARRTDDSIDASGRFEVRTADGLAIRGRTLGTGRDAVVFCHGFSGSVSKPRLVVVQQVLAERYTVFAFDFRGHGASEGVCTFGADEYQDVDAVVRLARDRGYPRVVTVGGSMGGVAAIRHAALAGGVDGVVAISTPATWLGHDSAMIRRLTWMTGTRAGRQALRAFGVRVTDRWVRAEDPADLVERIAPAPLVIIHGRDDHYFDEEQPWLLYRRAREPKRLLLASRFGHAEDGYTEAFARHLVELIP